MDRAEFTEKLSAASESSSKSPGEASEAHASISFHQSGIPLLISAKVLRSRNCGQIDLARFNKPDEIECWEVKSSDFFQYQHLKQRNRIQKSSEFLAQIFKASILMRYFVSKPRTLCEKQRTRLS